MTVIAVITQHYNVYCEESLNPAFSHIWVCALAPDGWRASTDLLAWIDYDRRVYRCLDRHVLPDSVLHSAQRRHQPTLSLLEDSFHQTRDLLVFLAVGKWAHSVIYSRGNWLIVPADVDLVPFFRGCHQSE